MSFSCAPALVSERGIARSEQGVHDSSRQTLTDSEAQARRRFPHRLRASVDSEAQAHRRFRHRLRANVGANSSQRLTNGNHCDETSCKLGRLWVLGALHQSVRAVDEQARSATAATSVIEQRRLRTITNCIHSTSSPSPSYRRRRMQLSITEQASQPRHDQRWVQTCGLKMIYFEILCLDIQVIIFTC